MLTFADKKVLSLQNKVIRTKTFILCNTYHLHLSSSVDNSHKASLTLQTWSALHLCTSPPPSCHMFQRPNPHPSVLHAIMDERFWDWIKGEIVEWAAKGVFLSHPGPIIVYLCQSLTHWLRTFQQLVVTNRAELWPWYSKKFKFKDFSYLLCRFVKTVTCISYTLSHE